MTPERWKRIEELYDRALACEPGERERFLAEACGGDEDLRREVDSLLSSAEQAGDFLERPALEVAARGYVSTVMVDLTGRKLGRYEVLKRVGRGGMGEVYRARDTRLKRQVALKVLPPERLADPERKRRFEQEARAASALDHPNIVTIHDIDQAEGIEFIAMECVEGQTLAERIGRKGLPVPHALKYAVQIADALAAAHQAGIVHRDLKPGNLMVTEKGTVKVLDFGLAKLTEPPQQGDEVSTETLRAPTVEGTILGTVAYMSPEQAEGRPVDARSDIFAFGSLLYEMVTGQKAFQRDTQTSTLAAILRDTPPPPKTVRPEIPVELGRIISKLLEKDRERRYQSARDLLVDLRNLERDSDSGVAVAGFPRRRVLRYVLAGVVALVALGSAALFWFTQRSKPIDSVAVLPFVNVGGDPQTEYLSDGITENLINSFSQLSKLRVVPRSLAFGYKGREVDPRKVGRELNVRAVLMGRVVQRGESLNIQTELVNVAEVSQLWGRQYSRKFSEIITVQEEITKEVSERLGVRPTSEEQKRLVKRSTANPEAHQLYLKGRYYWNRRTREMLRRGAEQFQQAIEKDPGYALAWAGLADCYALYGAYNVLEPKEAVPRAKEAARRALEIDETLAEPHAAIGFVKMGHDWDWPGAEAEFRRAIALDPNYATVYSWYGLHLAAMGRLDEGIAQAKRAQELEPVFLIINSALGWNFYFARRYDEAIGQLRKTLELEPNFASVHRYLGLAYEQRGMYAEASAAFQRAWSLAGAGPTDLAWLGHTYGAWGKRGEAHKVVVELMELSKNRYVPKYEIAVVYIGLKDRDQAFEWLERAYADRSFQLCFLKVDPRLDGIRGDARYRDLLRRMGLPP